jgi:hypothetical protein
MLDRMDRGLAEGFGGTTYESMILKAPTFVMRAHFRFQ